LDGEFELRKFVAPEFVFGSGARFLLGRYLKNFAAKKVLLVTDPGIVSSGWLDEIIGALEFEGYGYEIYSRDFRLTLFFWLFFYYGNHYM
jgi:alcohol dehydrogenase class IV